MGLFTHSHWTFFPSVGYIKQLSKGRYGDIMDKIEAEELVNVLKKLTKLEKQLLEEDPERRYELLEKALS
ncbi:hypothetical protein GOV09_06770 [Candidatus Woesearchaeota archaeon]|nr:hypothetical protein [Candidatus Woesearchaeota archaeon]